MNQADYDYILAMIGYDERALLAMKRLWKKYQRLQGAAMYNNPPTINIYYDKPDDTTPDVKPTELSE